MTSRERALAVLRFQPYDRLPLVHFGYWEATLDKWQREGHISPEEAGGWEDGNCYDLIIGERLGFDFNWYNCYTPITFLFPEFEREVLEFLPGGMRKVRDRWGVIVLEKDDTVSIPAEVDHLLKGRKEWEEHYLPRLQYNDQRITATTVMVGDTETGFQEGGLDYLKVVEGREYPIGIHCGSLLGRIRDVLGLLGLSYLSVDDEALYDEMVATAGELAYACGEKALDTGALFDFAHFSEDICFRSGPLVHPDLFDRKVGPYYKRITDLVRSRGIDIVSLDCDGCIDALVPTWLNNGVNTMFPIEVGTWQASIEPWRKKHGKALLGVGGMNKTVLSRDYAAVDAEIERLKPLVELGGYIPCPDHRIAPDAKWENVQYYCEKMRTVFG